MSAIEHIFTPSDYESKLKYIKMTDGSLIIIEDRSYNVKPKEITNPNGDKIVLYSHSSHGFVPICNVDIDGNMKILVNGNLTNENPVKISHDAEVLGRFKMPISPAKIKVLVPGKMSKQEFVKALHERKF